MRRPSATNVFRALVTGSRNWSDTDAIADALAALRAEHGRNLVIVHGACPRGADAIADAWCRRTGTTVERHPADWSTGRSAGHRRNTAMVGTRPDLCLAFIRDTSPGATGCAALAERAGIPTVRRTGPTGSPARDRYLSFPDRLLSALVDRVVTAPEGRRRRTLYGVARRAARMVAADAIARSEAIAALTDAGRRAEQTERDIRAAIAGAFRDRGVPLRRRSHVATSLHPRSRSTRGTVPSARPRSGSRRRPKLTQ